MTDHLANLVPHRVVVTTCASLVGAILIVGSALAFVKKDTFIARRKSSQYVVLATIGLMFYLRDNFALVWTYPAHYDDNIYNTFLYYLIAVPVHFLPVMVRSWRIFCIYRPTPNWRFGMDNNLVVVPKRGHAWMFIRMGVAYVPWFGVAFIMVRNTVLPYYIYIGLEGIYATVNLAINWKLFTIRDELRPKFLDETKSLLMYSVISMLEWMWTNLIYLIMRFKGWPYLLVVYIYGDLVLILLMWSLTGGKNLYRVWVKRFMLSDNKPELTYSVSCQITDEVTLSKCASLPTIGPIVVHSIDERRKLSM